MSQLEMFRIRLHYVFHSVSQPGLTISRGFARHEGLWPQRVVVGDKMSELRVRRDDVLTTGAPLACALADEREEVAQLTTREICQKHPWKHSEGGGWGAPTPSQRFWTKPTETSAALQARIKPFRGSVSVLGHAEWSMDWVKTWTVPRLTATAVGSLSLYVHNHTQSEAQYSS